MEFDGDVGIPMTSIYDQRFLNEVCIDRHLSSFANKEKFKKVRLLGLMHIQQGLVLRSASISCYIEKEVWVNTDLLAIAVTRNQEAI